MTTYVDLLQAPDYLVVDTAAFDDNFWATNQAQMQIDAAKYGKELSVRTAAPAYTPSTITSMIAFEQWVQLQRDTGSGGVTPPSDSGSGNAFAVVGLLAAAGTAAWLLWK